jgi:hypothetical protein
MYLLQIQSNWKRKRICLRLISGRFEAQNGALTFPALSNEFAAARNAIEISNMFG